MYEAASRLWMETRIRAEQTCRWVVDLRKVKNLVAEFLEM